MAPRSYHGPPLPLVAPLAGDNYPLRLRDATCHTHCTSFKTLPSPSRNRSSFAQDKRRRLLMSQHSKLFASLVLGAAIVVTALALSRQVIAVAGEADAERLNRDILAYV